VTDDLDLAFSFRFGEDNYSQPAEDSSRRIRWGEQHPYLEGLALAEPSAPREKLASVKGRGSLRIPLLDDASVVSKVPSHNVGRRIYTNGIAAGDSASRPHT